MLWKELYILYYRWFGFEVWWWVSVEAQWGQNMRQKKGWFFWLEMSTGWHAKRWRTNSFVEWTSGGMVVIFQGGGNKKLADVGPWLRDKIVERFKQANVGPGWTRSWVATMSEWWPPVADVCFPPMWSHLFGRFLDSGHLWYLLPSERIKQLNYVKLVQDCSFFRWNCLWLRLGLAHLASVERVELMGGGSWS